MANQRSRGGSQQPGKGKQQTQNTTRKAQSGRGREPQRQQNDDVDERELQRRAGRDMQDDDEEE